MVMVWRLIHFIGSNVLHRLLIEEDRVLGFSVVFDVLHLFWMVQVIVMVVSHAWLVIEDVTFL